VSRRPALEEALVFVASAAFAVVADWRILTSTSVYNADASINLAWFRRVEEPALFQDPMTSALEATGFPPPGPSLLYHLVAKLGDPVVGAEWLGVLLAATAGWLVFRITRSQTDWRPGAWLAVGLFLGGWNILRLSGGLPHSFLHPIVLATVALLVSRRPAVATVVPPLGVLFYPPAALLSLGTLAIACLRSVRPPRVEWRLALLTVGSVVVTLVFSEAFVAEQDPLTRAEAKQYPEFGPDGKMHFFLPSTLEMLRQNYSGFDFRLAGSALIVGAIVLLLLGRVRLRREIWAMAISALAFFGIAYLVLFRLYLPSRYAYPLHPFAAIAIGAALLPAWRRTVASRGVALQALFAAAVAAVVFVVAASAFPLGPTRDAGELASAVVDVLPWVGGALVALLALAAATRIARGAWPRALGAALLGALLLGAVSGSAGIGKANGDTCEVSALTRFLVSLPPETIVAGNPMSLTCIPLNARRPVVISGKQFQPLLGRRFFVQARARMALSIRAYFGHSFAPLVELRRRYGADVFLVTPEEVREPVEWLSDRPFLGAAPYSDFVRRAAARRSPRASLRLPRECRLWRDLDNYVFDLRCVEAWVPSRSAAGT
jgi:hypothetical protein